MVCGRKRSICHSFFASETNYYLHNTQFIIKTDHKPLKYLLESPMQNKKIQLWALSMSGYNCTIEYIAGKTNTCVDLLSRHPNNVSEKSDLELHTCEETEEQNTLDINDNLFEINVLDSNQFDPRTFASCNLPGDESFEKCDLADFVKGGFDMKLEQTKDDTITEIRSMIFER